MKNRIAIATISAVALAAAGVAVAVRLKRKDGTETTVDDLSEVEVTGTLIDSPSPSRIRFTNPNGEKYRAYFDAAESRYGLPPGLLFRQAYQESHFRADIIDGRVRSKAGATGIMQIIPGLHPEITSGNLQVDENACLDVPTAIDYAGQLLKKWRKQFGSWSIALAAYNAGPGNVLKHNGIPPFTETRNYVSQIIADVPEAA